MPKHIYFSGIGGAGLFALAQLAIDCGYQVSGSDVEASQHTDWLKKHGAKIFLKQSGQEIEGLHKQHEIDWFVGTAALAPDHSEKAFAKQAGIKLSKRDEFIKTLVEHDNLKLIAVSGTHGKTTVTGMLIWLFKQAGAPLSYAIGTDISFGHSGQYQSGSQ